MSTAAEPQPVRYVPIGDSLTAGYGVGAANSWPMLLVRHLQQLQISISLITNPARSGYTTQQAIDHELPAFEAARPDFATLLIGSNDMARGGDASAFRNRYSYLLDKMQYLVPHRNRLLLFTLPDFAATPAARKYAGHLHIAPLIRSFNEVVEEQAQKRDLPLVDIYEITRHIGAADANYLADGLHPSARGYQEWEKAIRPVAEALLRQPPGDR